MEQTDERMIVSATDLVNHLECGHLSVLDLYAASQPGLRKPRLDDPAADVLRKRGDEHERRHLASLMATFEVIEIPAPGGQDRVSSLRAGEANTFAAMQAGADVIFQATFLDEREDVLWRGHADFLRKSATPSRLGSHSYEPEDAKLARRVKASAVLQLCQYRGAGRAAAGKQARTHPRGPWRRTTGIRSAGRGQRVLPLRTPSIPG